MNALLIYMFKAALYLSAFYLIYSILLSRDTSYSRNRAFIPGKQNGKAVPVWYMVPITFVLK